jgi:hypothetical protein
MQSKPVIRLNGTSHLQIRDLTVIDVETYLHRLATYLAVLNIRLVAAAEIQHNADWLPAERASQFAFCDGG